MYLLRTLMIDSFVSSLLPNNLWQFCLNQEVEEWYDQAISNQIMQFAMLYHSSLS